MFIKEHKAALLSLEADIEPYMVDGVVADSEGALSVMLPLVRNTIAIKFAEDDPDVATMVAHAFTMFERFCSSDQAYDFYNDIIASPKLYDRVMQFVTMILITDEPLGTLAISKAVNKKHGKLLSDIRVVGEIFGFYDTERKVYADRITRTAHLNGTTKELTLPPEIILLLMCYYINGQRVVAMMPW
ncbi:MULTISPECIES: hypothetical protein [unclassified Psychrobacter]|uniref:hypothetical protein n=1 Tax=unclassified Psychrobacter TaxID=196806 RepID=UPI000C7CD24E|nr:hypothetical protein [Psychrobacter sp. 4Bb]PKH82272.1 hypothetical protein CXF60_02050 [Psychrobacter sp. 4Bb]|tara:strand:+ start:6087 stop:6647 length:561 start_codon:yes stop_codon:yes gene_type:complete